MNKDLTWKLSTPPTDLGLAKLVEQGVYTAEEARAIIESKGVRDPASKKTTVVHLLIDQSGSMSGTRQSTVDGINEYVNTLKKDGGKYKVSLTMFDSDGEGKLRLDKPWKNVYIDDVPELTLDDYKPNGGTPLHDAFCMTLKSMADRKDEKHLFVVLTDGYENTSKEYVAEDMKKLKNKFEEKENWTFVYLGANQDAFSVSSSYGFTAQNTSNFNATNLGTNVMFANLGAATRSYSASASMSTASYFTPEQQKKNEQTK